MGGDTSVTSQLCITPAFTPAAGTTQQCRHLKALGILLLPVLVSGSGILVQSLGSAEIGKDQLGPICPSQAGPPAPEDHSQMASSSRTCCRPPALHRPLPLHCSGEAEWQKGERPIGAHPLCNDAEMWKWVWKG